MISFLYENYPYGAAEAFVEYEMQELAKNHNTKYNLYSFCKDTSGTERFIPENVTVIKAGEKVPFNAFVSAFFAMFSAESLKEVLSVLKEKHSEGFLRCIWRIYHYQVDAISFISLYKKAHKKGEGDVLASYWLNQYAFALVKLKRKFPEIKIISRGHGYDVYKERCYLPFRKAILSGLDKIYLINKSAKQYFRDNYGEWLDMSKVEIEHLGVSLPEKVADIDDTDVFRIVTCSSVIPLKRLDLMIDALSLIKDKKIEWVHFGGGPLLESTKDYAKQKLGDSSVSFVFMGQKRISEIQDYYAKTSINLFVNSSDTEGTPVSVMEAMSYGIPAIARNVGGNSEAVDDNCGKLIPSEASADALKLAIEEFYNMDNELYIAKRHSAREKIEREFNAKITYKEYIEKIGRLVCEEI